jgi:type II secretory pathway pseudopilin PulG
MVGFGPSSARVLSGRRSRWPGRGFTLVEVGLVALILVLIAFVAGAEIGRRVQRVRCDRLFSDLRTFAEAFQSCRRQRGVWPPASNGASGIPVGMESGLKNTPWLNRTPVGGSYRWMTPYPVIPRGDKTPPTGAIAVTAFTPDSPLTLSAADLLYLDRKFDDGNLATGNFRTGFNGWPVYIVSLPSR